MFLVLNQSPLSTIFAIVRFPGSTKFVLSGDPLYMCLKFIILWSQLALDYWFNSWMWIVNQPWIQWWKCLGPQLKVLGTKAFLSWYLGLVHNSHPVLEPIIKCKLWSLVINFLFKRHTERQEDIGKYVDAAMSSGILKAKQKLGRTFNSDKLGGIAFTKISKLTMCSA